ncbi:MAG: 16S rRNA processing protein RimM [Candidatus Binataceae bacterium]|nr:16S rRNA processing protein RimM [Candidatus Binataceae bacterium]
MGDADRLTPGPCGPAPSAAPGLIRVGLIGGAHGLQGALRIRLDNPDSATLATLRRVFVTPAGGGIGAREYGLLRVARISRMTTRMMLEGVGDATAAEALRGAVISVASGDLPAPTPGEYYHYEAVGCAVETLDGQRIGVIEEIFATGANDVWVVRDGAREVLVPVIDNVVKSIDLAARLMRIEAVPGLLD